MNNQEKSKSRKLLGLPTEVIPIYIKPRKGLQSPGEYLGIYLPYDNAQIQSGTNDQWDLSLVSITAPIQGFTIYEGAPQEQDYNETNLNCLTFSQPKRIEIVTSDALDSTPYLVFQEIVKGGSVTGWQIYAPTPFAVVQPSHKKPQTWQDAVSTEPVSIKQVRLYENCDFDIKDTPPAIPGALFQKVTTKDISEVSLWR